ncbi:MAG: redoxin domain-containing protein [Candidatus Eisenbacteria bacterium]
MQTMAVPQVGQDAPDFKLKGPGGSFYTLSEYRGDKSVVLLFYPLAFSSVCSHQLPAVQKELARFEAAGAAVFGISVDSHYANTAFAKQLGLTFPLLSDWKHEAAKAYGVLIPEAGYTARATFVVDKAGKVSHLEVSEHRESVEFIPSIERALAAAGKS